MTTKLFKEYLAFFQKDFVHVKVLNNTTLEIRGVQHTIRKRSFDHLIATLMYTEFIQEIDYNYVQKLYKAMQQASLNSILLLERCTTKSKEAIDLFIELVDTETTIKRLDKEIKVINS